MILDLHLVIIGLLLAMLKVDPLLSWNNSK